MAFGCIRSGSLTSACASRSMKISLANAQHEGAERELAEIEEEIESIIAQSQEVTVRIDEVRHGAARLEEEAARLEAQAAVADNSILHNNDTIARIQKDQEQAEETCRHLEERIAQERGAIEALIRQAGNSMPRWRG